MTGSHLQNGRLQRKLQRILPLVQPKVLARLTYPAKFPSVTEAMKHLEQIIEYLKENNNLGIWFLVFQVRGAPYFYLILSRYVPKEALSEKWFNVVASGDPAHLRAGVSVSGFQFYRGASQFLKKVVFPFTEKPDFQYGTFGSIKAKLISWF